MTSQEIQEFVALGHEQRKAEFKGPGTASDPAFFAGVTRAMLAMANTRDGGFVIVGIEDNGDSLKIVGLEPDDLKTWTQDYVASKLGEYAQPYVSFSLEKVKIDETSVVVLHVSEFDGIPVLCKKDYSLPGKADSAGKLVRGACYVRSLSHIRSVNVSSEADMRELLAISVEKELTKLIGTMSRAGASASFGLGPLQQQVLNANGAWKAQIDDMDTTSPIVEKLKKRGYWRVIIQPSKVHQAELVDLLNITQTIQANQVTFRGWYFPHCDPNKVPLTGSDWQGCDTDWESRIEAWRQHTNGLFILYKNIWADWRDQGGHYGAPPEWKACKEFSIEDAIATCTESFELARRMSLLWPVVEQWQITVEVYGIKGRELTISDRRGPLFSKYEANVLDTKQSQRTVTLAELQGESPRLARECANKIFEAFVWKASDVALTQMQEEIGVK